MTHLWVTESKLSPKKNWGTSPQADIRKANSTRPLEARWPEGWCIWATLSACRKLETVSKVICRLAEPAKMPLPAVNLGSQVQIFKIQDTGSFFFFLLSFCHECFPSNSLGCVPVLGDVGRIGGSEACSVCLAGRTSQGGENPEHLRVPRQCVIERVGFHFLSFIDSSLLLLHTQSGRDCHWQQRWGSFQGSHTPLQGLPTSWTAVQSEASEGRSRQTVAPGSLHGQLHWLLA